MCTFTEHEHLRVCERVLKPKSIYHVVRAAFFCAFMGLKCSISAATSHLNGGKEIIHWNILTASEQSLLHIPAAASIKDKRHVTLGSSALVQCPLFDTGEYQMHPKKTCNGLNF